MSFQERVFDALPAQPRESTIAVLARELGVKDGERKAVIAALHRLKGAGRAINNGARGPASAWSRTNGSATPAARAVPAVADAPPPEPFQAAIDHRGRIAVRADGVGVQIRHADALELLAFLQQMEDVIAFHAKGAKK